MVQFLNGRDCYLVETDHSKTEPVDKNTRWLTKKSQTIWNPNNSPIEQLWSWSIRNAITLGIWAHYSILCLTKWKWFVSPCYDCRFWPEFFRLRWGTWVHPPVRPPSCWRKRPSGGGRQTNRDWKNQVLSFGVRFSNGSGQPFKNRTKMSSFQTIVRIFHLILDQFIFLLIPVHSTSPLLSFIFSHSLVFPCIVEYKT